VPLLLTPSQVPAPTDSIVKVALPNAALFDYRWPSELGALTLGIAVKVPLGARFHVGYVIAKIESSPHSLRSIQAIVNEVPALPADLIQLAEFGAAYYLANLADFIRLMVPKPVRRLVIEHFRLTVLGQKQRKDHPQHVLHRLQRARTLAAINKKLKLGIRETRAQIETWITQGWMERIEGLSTSTTEVCLSRTAQRVEPLQLTSEQQAAVTDIETALNENAYRPFLLWGITGSGKTEIYLAAIEHTLRLGRSAIVLVPEIGLTPQVSQRFESRFGNEVITLHSAMTASKRREVWTAIQNQKARVVIGPRSALFVPLQNLGLFIVDEEHDDSYKQEETPRYHARDLGLVRAQQNHAVAILGSATPSLESLHNVQRGKFTLLRLNDRPFGRELPEVQIVTLRKKGEGPVAPIFSKSLGLISEPLYESILATLARNEQVILFLNRRGFAPFVLCESCGTGVFCPHCSVSLTHHLRHDQLLCHYCGHHEPTPKQCLHCQSIHLRTMGSGTERLEHILKQLFPQIHIGRLDRDTIAHRSRLNEVLTDFRRGKLQILLGTQMVTKGHDFPHVTLVGVIMADLGLNFPDFRASERTAQLLVQVAGRAGRQDISGHVLIQTFYENHPALIAAKSHDYFAFAKVEDEERRTLNYPPHARLILLRLGSKLQTEVETCATQLATELVELIHPAELLGPAPCPIARLRGIYRWMILLKTHQPQTTKTQLREYFANFHLPRSVQFVVDVDPISML